MPKLTTSTVAINMYLMAGQGNPCWFTPMQIVSRLKAHDPLEVANKLTDMVNSGDLMRARNQNKESIFSLTTHPLNACN